MNKLNFPTDKPSRILYKAGGWTSVLFLIYSFVSILIMILLDGGYPDSAIECFEMIKENRFIALLRLDIISIIVVPFAYQSFIKGITEHVHGIPDIETEKDSAVNAKIPARLLRDFLPAIKEYVNEADRTYRNFVSIYSDEFLPAVPSGEGLFRIRLIFSLFMPYLYLRQNPNKESEFTELFNFASGIAIEDLIRQDSFPTYSRDDAKKVAPEVLKDVIKNLTNKTYRSFI